METTLNQDRNDFSSVSSIISTCVCNILVLYTVHNRMATCSFGMSWYMTGHQKKIKNSLNSIILYLTPTVKHQKNSKLRVLLTMRTMNTPAKALNNKRTDREKVAKHVSRKHGFCIPIRAILLGSIPSLSYNVNIIHIYTYTYIIYTILERHRMPSSTRHAQVLQARQQSSTRRKAELQQRVAMDLQCACGCGWG